MPVHHDRGMSRYTELPPLWLRLCAAAGLPPDASLDVAHQRVKVVGRGTLQRIRSGVEGTQIKSIQAIADELRVPVSVLLDKPSETCQKNQPMGVEGIVEQLAALLDVLAPEGQEGAAKALAALAAAPDSAKARAALVRALGPADALGKRRQQAA